MATISRALTAPVGENSSTRARPAHLTDLHLLVYEFSQLAQQRSYGPRPPTLPALPNLFERNVGPGDEWKVRHIGSRRRGVLRCVRGLGGRICGSAAAEVDRTSEAERLGRTCCVPATTNLH